MTARLTALCCLALRLALAADDSFEELARRASDALDTNPAQAADLYQQALALRPDWAAGWLYEGAALFQLGRLTQARTSLEKGVALDPTKGTAAAFLGLVEHQLGDDQAALAHLLKGEALGLPDKAAFVQQVYYTGALIRLRSANFPEALEQLRPLAKHGLQFPAAVSALGLSALALPYLPDTIPVQRRALVDLAGRAAWAFLAERPDDAGPLFEQLRTQFPNEPGVHYISGVFLIDRDRAAAEQEFRKELRLTPSHLLARVQLAQLLSKEGNSGAAIRLAQEAVQLAPSDALCQVTLGRVLLDAGRTHESLPALEKAEQLAPQVAKTHFYLLQAYRRAGRLAEAQKEKAQWERLHAAEEPADLVQPPQP